TPVSGAGTNVGTYDYGLATSQFSYNDENVTATFAVTDGFFAISPAAVTVTADDKSKIAGNADPDLTATVEGTIGTDTVAYELARAEGEAAGEYAITPTGDAVQGNYAVTFVPGTFRIIGAQAMVISVADAETGATTTNYVATLADAFLGGDNGAKDGDTVELLGDVTLDARILVTNSVTIDLGGQTITRTAAPNRDNGSVFRVDGDYDVTIKNGAIDCSGVDDTSVIGDGVFAIDVKNGADLTLADLDITVDSRNGACVYPWAGSTVAIESGNYANRTDEPYDYHRNAANEKDWVGMAVNQANVAETLITIRGGTFSQVDPALGDDSAAAGAMTFVDDAFISVAEGGAFTVRPAVVVTFETAKGEAPAAQKIAVDSAAADPDAPQETGWTFRAWTLDGADWNFADGVPEDITLVADWTPNADTPYAVHYRFATIADATEYVADAALLADAGKTGTTDTTTAETAPAVEGFAAKPVEQVNIDADGSAVVTVYYDRNRVTISFDSKGGSAVPSLEGVYGAAVSAPADPTKEGFTFLRWTPGVPETFPASDLSLVAKWDRNFYVLRWLDHTGVASSTEIDFGDPLPDVSTVAARPWTGHTFKAWTPDPADYPSMPAANLDFTATWYTNVVPPAAIASKVYDGTLQTADVEPVDGMVVKTNAGGTDAGTYDVVLSLANADGYIWDDGTFEDKTFAFVITKAAATITVADASKTYGDADPVFTGAVEGLAAAGDLDEIAYVRTNDAQTAGVYEGVLSATYAANANYDVTVVPGDFTITTKALTVTAGSGEQVYDGTALEVTAYTATDLAAGDSFAEVSVTGSRTDVGASSNVVSVTSITNALGADVTGNYAITAVDGELKVTKATVTVVADAKTQVYGEAAQPLTYTSDPATLVEGNSFSGALERDAGDNVGTYAIKQGTLSAGDNYEISFTGATYTITAAPMTITVAGCDEVYNGQPHAASATTQPTGATVTWSTDGGTTWTADVPSIVNVGTNEVLAQAVLENYATVTSSVAKLVVTPKALTVTAASDTKAYDGEPLTNPTYTAGELAAGDTIAAATVTGSQTTVGASSNVVAVTSITNAVGADVTGNYAITAVDGELRVTAKAVTVTVASTTESKTYSGAEQSYTPSLSYTSNEEEGSTLFDVAKVTFSGVSTLTLTEVGTTNQLLAADQFGYTDNNLEVTFRIAEGKDGAFTITPAAAVVITVADGGATTNETYFATLAEALEAAPENSTVRLLEDVEEPAVALDTPITIDLNGNTWTVVPAEGEDEPGTVTVAAAVSVVDDSQGGGGAIVSASDPVVAVAQGGALTVGGGAAINLPDDAQNGTAVEVAAGGALVVDGGTVGGDVDSSGTVHVDAGIVAGDIEATGGDASVTVAGGTVDGDVNVLGGASVAVSGGTVTGDIDAAGAGSTVAVSGGDVEGGIVADGGAGVRVTDGSVGGGIEVGDGSSVEVAGGEVEGGIDAAEGSTVAVSDGEVSGGIVAGGDLEISGGTVSGGLDGEPAVVARGDADISGGTVSGVVNVQGEGDLTISGSADVEGNVTATGADASVEVAGGSVNGNVTASDGADIAVSGGEVTGNAVASGDGSTVAV
ncbi:MAG: InlB B-repeat-containing protein, partial [Kiritimatiellae bacterium]|nr:InlB B-repeat-containing protein [Kiritimatiellia bacterium]